MIKTIGFNHFKHADSLLIIKKSNLTFSVHELRKTVSKCYCEFFNNLSESVFYYSQYHLYLFEQ